MSNPIHETSSSSASHKPQHHAPPFYVEEAGAGISSLLTEEKGDLVLSLTPSTTLVDENRVNQLRLLHLRKRFTSELLALINDEDFEYGIENRADKLIKQQMSQNALATRAWLNHMFVQYFPYVPVLLGLLRIVARLPYLEAYPEGQTMALAALSHKNYQVQECGVRAFESWGTLQSLHILENLKVSTPWLQEYVNQVLVDLKERYNAHPGQED